MTCTLHHKKEQLESLHLSGVIMALLAAQSTQDESELRAATELK